MSLDADRTEPAGAVATSEHPGAEEEPAVLGAAATLPAQRKERSRPRWRRRRRSDDAPETAGPTFAPLDGTYSGVQYVFEPHAAALPPLREYLSGLWARRPFMVENAKAELRGTRSSTLLGSIWGIIDPAFQAGIYFFLFTVISRGGRSIDFLHVLIAGIFLFQLATSALTEGGNSIRQSKNLMLNSAFPRALLPISTLYKGLLKFAPTVFVYAGAHLILGAPIHLGLLLLPVLFALQLVLMLGVSLLVSTITVFFKDARNVVNYISRLLFFTTPVIYPLSMLSDSLRSLLSWQPFFPLFASYQLVLTGDVPSAWMLVQVALWALVFLLVGAWAFLRHERNFAIHL